MKIKAVIVLLTAVISACAENDRESTYEEALVVISVLGTNDVHGQLLPEAGRGALTTLSGYIEALRATRSADNGGMLLIDAGDMWQGTLESNLSEGATVVEVYNLLGYSAATVGNHEFDFGPAGPAATPQSDADDARGALKRRATEANFPFLAANLIDTATNKPVDWPNVKPSMIVEVAGVRVGILGIMSSNALYTTMAANVRGLRVASLAETILGEATSLREQGAALVIVTAHAGGQCTEFDDPLDISSCDLSGEIMQVASELPAGLVDHIIAGHMHQGIAHVVNGIAITSSYANTRAFSRVDFTVDRATGITLERKVFPPQFLCRFVDTTSGECAESNDGTELIVAASYEGQPIIENDEVIAIARRAEEFARERKAQKLGVYLETPITLEGRPESALGNLMTDALRDMSSADISLHNVSGGIRANLPEGDLSYGSLYQMFPFDNQLMILEMSGADVRKVIEGQVFSTRHAGFSGMQVFVTCDADQMTIEMLLEDGRTIQDEDIINVAVNDFLALGGDEILLPVLPDGGFDIPNNIPLARDELEQWFTTRGGRLRADQFLDPDMRRWNLPVDLPQDCSL